MMLLVWMGLAFGQTMPAVQAETLSGQAIALPGSLKAARTVLVISFQREHQAVSTAWRTHLLTLNKEGRVDWFELAYLDVSAPMRLAIGTAMDLGTTDAIARAHVAPVWASHEPVRKALGVASDAEVAVVVLDKQGAVVAKVMGDPSEANVKALKAAIP